MAETAKERELPLLFACSGAADVGAVADQAARLLTRERQGRMYCATGIGGRVPGILATTRAAARVVAIDGCPLHCMQQSLQQAGITGFTHVRLAEHGFVKGATAVTAENAARAAALVTEAIHG
ncbi:MAG TPA: putative zinc-binding protein [bacterium]|nr:putative zinc-binding protein [bacterium]